MWLTGSKEKTDKKQGENISSKSKRKITENKNNMYNSHLIKEK